MQVTVHLAVALQGASRHRVALPRRELPPLVDAVVVLAHGAGHLGQRLLAKVASAVLAEVDGGVFWVRLGVLLGNGLLLEGSDLRVWARTDESIAVLARSYIDSLLGRSLLRDFSPELAELVIDDALVGRMVANLLNLLLVLRPLEGPWVSQGWGQEPLRELLHDSGQVERFD